MTLFGRELTLEQTIGFVRCNAAPNEDLVHMAALELIVALQDAQRRERAAVEDMQLIAGDIGSPLTCAVCKYNPNDMGCELDGSQFNDNCECHFTWRGPREAEGRDKHGN